MAQGQLYYSDSQSALNKQPQSVTKSGERATPADWPSVSRCVCVFLSLQFDSSEAKEPLADPGKLRLTTMGMSPEVTSYVALIFILKFVLFFLRIFYINYKFKSFD